MLAKNKILVVADELGIPREPATDDVIELVKRKLSLESCHWPEVVKRALREPINCPLGLICYPSCFWWKDGKCTFPEVDK